jgi:hypothetical protein
MTVISQNAINSAATTLRAVLASADKDPALKAIIDAKDEVLNRYQPVFSVEHIAKLTEDEFRSFLLSKNNHHWSGLHRKGNSLCSDLPRLKEALGILLDEAKPLKDRLDTLLPPSAPPFMPMLGKALVTAILHVAHNDRYGVYNGTSEAGMHAVGVWPRFDRGAAFSERYIEINSILTQLAAELKTDLWTLDGLWWRVKSGDEDDQTPPTTPLPDEEDAQGFGLERHLQDFMFDNWDKISPGQEWNLHVEDSEIVGCEYNTNEIGRIDLLAKHKFQPRWLVIELKRQQSSDDTVGQVLRYMGWVQQHLAVANESVHGLIIARQPDARLRYALMHTKNVGLMCYRVDFQLDEVPGLTAG